MKCQGHLPQNLASAGVLGTVLLLGLACRPDASAPFATAAQSVSVSTMVKRPPNAKYVEQSRRVVQGQRVNGGCAVTGKDTLRVGESRLEWVAEYDTLSCAVTLARGVYVGPSRPPQGAIRIDTDTAAIQPSSSGSLLSPTSALQRANVSDRSARLRHQSLPSAPSQNSLLAPCDGLYDAIYEAHNYLYTEDPVGIEVTRDNLTYQFWTRPSLNCIQAAQAVHYMSWYTTSGWYQTSAVWYHNYIAADQTYADVKVSSSFQNLIFCNPSLYTYVIYNPNQIRVFPDGHATYDYTWNTFGDCGSSLFTYRSYGVVGG